MGNGGIGQAMEGLSMARQAQASLVMVEATLERILNELKSDPAVLCITDGSPPEVITKDFPFPGSTRAIVRRSTIGPNVPVAGSGLLWEDNANRLGGIVTNKAAAGVTLFLADGPRIGAGSVYLPAVAAGMAYSWNFLLGALVWCGNVWAVPDSGAVNVAGATV